MSRRAFALLFAVVVSSRPPSSMADEPEPTRPPTATPSPADVPRFGVEVTGRNPQAALEQHFLGFDICGAAGDSAPTVDQGATQRPRPSRSVNLIPAFRALAREGKKLFHKKKPARYLLYRIARSESTTYLVNDGLLREAVRFAPNTVVEVVAVFPDRKSATRARQRLEQGHPLAQVLPSGCGDGR